jgi:hypothetical protein
MAPVEMKLPLDVFQQDDNRAGIWALYVVNLDSNRPPLAISQQQMRRLLVACP